MIAFVSACALAFLEFEAVAPGGAAGRCPSRVCVWACISPATVASLEVTANFGGGPCVGLFCPGSGSLGGVSDPSNMSHLHVRGLKIAGDGFG